MADDLEQTIRDNATGPAEAQGDSGRVRQHIQAGDVIDIYWSGGLRYNVTVDTVVGNDVTFDDTPAAAGDALPAQDTAVTASKQTTIDMDFDGDPMKMIVACSTRSC